MLKDAKAVIATGDVPLIVDLAIEANRTINAAKDGLEGSKNFLREAALSRAQSGSVELDGNLGSAQVVIPEPRPRAKPGVDLPACVRALPVEMVEKLFLLRTVVDFAPDFEARVTSLPTEQQAAVWNLIKMADQTPRVVLPE